MNPLEDPGVAAWIGKRDEDLAMLDLAWASGKPLWGPMCFHAQQAAEKSLKALLTAAGIEPPRTHDLEVVIDLLQSLVPSITTCADDGALLSDYSVLSRYPLIEDIGRPRAEAATAACRRIVSAVDEAFATIPRRPPDGEHTREG